MQTTLTSVASAAVISGDLIIGLSDGSIINCGRVQGPIGLTGDQGPMGATGRGGSDGNTIHTVQGTPDTTLGKDGDFAINVKIWEIYGPRAGGVWGTGTPLRGNKRNGGSEQKDNIFGNSQSDGGGGVDLPPVIIDDEPPKKGNNNKPVRQGDLWFDADQFALYVAAKDASNNLVWVIATPHNREGLVSNIPAGRGSAEHTFPAAIDKQIEYNLVTDTNYIYNAAKKQWIDISQMVHYGAKPPAFAPKGAMFTDEATLKQFVQISQGVWVEKTSCGAGAGNTPVEEPWIYISDFRTTRLHESNAWGTVSYKQRILFYAWNYNDRYPSTITSEWEWDELGDGNWVSYKPENDPYAVTDHNFTGHNFWEYYWAPESADGTASIDPAHPHPCTKLRGRLVNTWNDGQSKPSDWVECYLGRSAVPANGDTLKPPSVCTP